MDIMKMLKNLVKEMMSFLKKLNKMNLKDKVMLVGLFALFYVVTNLLIKQCRLTERFSPFSANKTMGPLDALTQDKPKEQSGGKMKLVMYSMSTCGFCKRSKQKKQKIMGKNLSNCDCEIKEDAQNDPEWKKIQGFPTFKMHKSNGEVEVYGEDKSKCLNSECKRDALSLEHFVSECGKA